MFSFLFFVAIMSAMFTGCSKDDDGAGFDKTELLGYWSSETDEFELFADGTCYYAELTTTAKGTFVVDGDRLIFKLVWSDDHSTDILVYTIKSLEKQKRMVLADEDGDLFTFHYNGDKYGDK